MTVLGWTMMRASSHRVQIRESHADRIRSDG
jgi:hypothetical protein